MNRRLSRAHCFFLRLALERLRTSAISKMILVTCEFDVHQHGVYVREMS